MRAGLYTTARPTPTTFLAVSTWLSPLPTARPVMSSKFKKLTLGNHKPRPHQGKN